MKTNSHTPLCEDYVPFEIAKLLKEKGFEKDIFKTPSLKVFKGNRYCINREDFIADDDICIPTLQMAMKWLREVHNIHIELNPICTGDSNEELEWHYGWAVRTTVFIDRWKRHDAEHISYEEACKAAIKYCLENLI